MTTVRLDKVSKVFPGGALALDGVDLTVADGEFLVLVGPSGCGKSTVLRVIAGLEDATSGSVTIDGQDVANVPPKDRDVAMVFQNYALYPHLTVRDNLAFALRLRGVSKPEREAKVRETARALEIEGLLGRKPKSLSGGQRQRVATGRAIVRTPRILLMDEPLSNLDAQLRVTMRAELRRLHAAYRATTIYVTHDQVEAMTLGDRIAVIDHGRIQQAGTPHDLYQTPANRFVGGFIGSPSMNFTDGRVVRGRPPMLVVDGVGWPLPPKWSTAADGIVAGGGAVTVGLRPDALVWPAPPGWPTIEAPVSAVEFLGNAIDVLFTPPGRQGAAAGSDVLWTAKVPRHCPVAVGDRVTFGVDVDAIHLFDTGGVAWKRETAAGRVVRTGIHVAVRGSNGSHVTSDASSGRSR